MIPSTTNVRPLSGHVSSPLRTEAEAALNGLLKQLDRSESVLVNTQRDNHIAYCSIVIQEMAKVMLAKQRFDAAKEREASAQAPLTGQ